MAEGNAYESQIVSALARFRRFKGVHPPALLGTAVAEDLATVAPKARVDLDDLLDGAPDVRIVYVQTPLERPRVDLALRRPHPGIVGLIAFRGVTEGTLEMLPGLRFAEFAFGPPPAYQPAALPSQLEELWANGLDLDALARFERLKFLHTVLETGKVANCRSLANLSELRTLHLGCVERLRGIEALARLPHLEELVINKVAPFDLAALSSCRSLRRLSLGGHDVDLEAARAGRPQKQAPVEPVAVSQTDDGRWTIYQDLSESLDCDDNHHAESLVKARLRRANPSAAERVTFDSEADAFCAYAASRDDLEKVVAAVAAVRARRSPG
jgi:hypothetical protein